MASYTPSRQQGSGEPRRVPDTAALGTVMANPAPSPTWQPSQYSRGTTRAGLSAQCTALPRTTELGPSTSKQEAGSSIGAGKLGTRCLGLTLQGLSNPKPMTTVPKSTVVSTSPSETKYIKMAPKLRAIPAAKGRKYTFTHFSLGHHAKTHPLQRPYHLSSRRNTLTCRELKIMGW